MPLRSWYNLLIAFAFTMAAIVGIAVWISQDDENQALLKAEKLAADIQSRKADYEARKVERNALEKKVTAKVNLLQQRKQLLEEIQSLETRLANTAYLRSAYAKSFREVVLPAGSNLGNIILSDGRKLTNASITTVELPNVGIRHDNGIGSYPTSLLPADLQMQFVLKPKSLNFKEMPGVQGIMDTKPSFLLSHDEIQQQREDRHLTEQAARDQERRLEMARHESQRAAADAEAQRNEAQRQQQMETSRQKRAQLDVKIGQLMRQRNNIRQPSVNSYGRVQRSQADIDRAQNHYRNQVSALDAEISKLEAERSALPW